MKVSTFLALKFLSGRHRSWLFSSLTLMALLGVIVSVTAFVVVQGVMSGFNEDLKHKIMGFSSHVTLVLQHGKADPSELYAQVASHPRVKSAHRLMDGEAILRTEDELSQGVRVRGIEPAHPPQVKDLQVFFEEGEDWASFAGQGEELPGILLGSELAGELGVLPVLAEKVELLYPFGEVGPTGEVEPNLRAFRVVGTFKSGYYEYDSKYAMVPLQESRFLFGEPQNEKIAVFLRRSEEAPSLKNQFEKLPGLESVQIWQEQHRRLFSALKLERLGMMLVLGLMLTLASFNILSMLMMVVYERRQDIAVLRSLGLTQKKIGEVFFRAGLWIGLGGSLMGIALGAGICVWLASAKPSLPSSYYLDALPVQIHWRILLGALILAPALSVLATLVPAREGKRLNILEALRYE